MIKEIEFNFTPEKLQNPKAIKEAVASKLKIKIDSILEVELLKRSIDARKKPITYCLRVAVYINQTKPLVEPKHIDPLQKKVDKDKEVIVIGAGPAGLFASLKLLSLGYRPIILERGKEVSLRKKDVAKITIQGIVNSNSNWCFGEGGAGTFSDGKLYTRSNKRGNIKEVLQMFVDNGAQSNILVDAHAHIGTDKLSGIIKNIHSRIEGLGGEYHFDCLVTDLIIKDNTIQGVRTSEGQEYIAPNVILATGSSARDIYVLLKEKNIALEAKPFAMGVRVEHPQELINQIQYHSKTYSQLLPPATYALAENIGSRGVFSFCMCPGGVVIPSATQQGECVANGMSNSGRTSPFANSGLVVSVIPSDAMNYSQYGELALMYFQQEMEKRAYTFVNTNKDMPAQRLIDFLESKPSINLAKSSYFASLCPVDMNEMLPKFISQTLKAGIALFEKKMRGFITRQATLIGLESRTSSPVRIVRNSDTLMSQSIKGLYPCGEGAGYAGGITSSAIDGINIANKIAAAER